jgi:hypothetical protein
MRQEDQSLSSFSACMGIFQLSNRFAVRVICLRNVPVSPTKEAYVDIASSYIFEAFFQRALGCSDVFLHRNDLVSRRPQRMGYALSKID